MSFADDAQTPENMPARFHTNAKGQALSVPQNLELRWVLFGETDFKSDFQVSTGFRETTGPGVRYIAPHGQKRDTTRHLCVFLFSLPLLARQVGLTLRPLVACLYLITI